MNAKYFFKRIAAPIAFAALLAACSQGGFKICGEIGNADPDSYIVLERAEPSGDWFTLDSAKLSDGKFSFSGERPQAPQIYRLKLGNEYIYLPIDSTETVSVKADAKTFSTSFSLDGSEDAKNLAKFEKELIAFTPHAENADSLNAFKRRVYTEYLKEARGSVVSYYILTKTLGGRPLYGDADDYRYFAAVATSFRQFCPDDPRTALLEQAGLDAMRRHNQDRGKQRVIEANEITLVDITLPDEEGNVVNLSDVAGKGTKTVVVFADMNREGSPELNMKLRRIQESGRANIYHVSFDADRFSWREAARNLPWTTVWAGDITTGRRVATDYNVNSMPLFFIYSADGHLTGRAESFEELNSTL